MQSLKILLVLIGLSALMGCTKKVSSPQQSLTGEALVARGKTIYAMNCLACHHAEPGKDGAVGPGVAGADLELLRDRILHATYPPGYKPKRDTHLMVALPHLEKELEALHAYLNSEK